MRSLNTFSTCSCCGTRAWPGACRADLDLKPGKTLVVLGGAGHVEYRGDILAEVQRRLPVPSATVINGTLRPFDPDSGGLHPVSARHLAPPASGLLGVMLDIESEGD